LYTQTNKDTPKPWVTGPLDIVYRKEVGAPDAPPEESRHTGDRAILPPGVEIVVVVFRSPGADLFLTPDTELCPRDRFQAFR
jgi:hypothetical protein